MKRYKKQLLLFLLSLVGLQSAIAQDFKIDKFRENTMDMSAATSGVKDLNGNIAGLIRFVVRDDKFEFDANLGVLKKVMKTGEVWLYVPQGTKRVNVSHPLLGVLRGYELPEVVKSKTTYDAEIVITNETYLRTLMERAGQKEKEDSTSAPVKPVAKDTIPRIAKDSIPHIARDTASTVVGKEPIADDADKAIMEKERIRDKNKDFVYVLTLQESADSSRLHRTAGNDFGIALGYSLINMSGPTASIELSSGSFCIEAGGVFGNQKATDIGIYSYSSIKAYDYTALRGFANMGIIFNPKSKLQFTLKGGAAFTYVKGKELGETSMRFDFDYTHIITAYCALRTSFAFGKHLQLFAIPEYHFDVNHGDTFEIIKEADKTIENWANGISVRLGLLVKF